MAASFDDEPPNGLGVGGRVEEVRTVVPGFAFPDGTKLLTRGDIGRD